jgi:hypothetical protein
MILDSIHIIYPIRRAPIIPTTNVGNPNPIPTPSAILSEVESPLPPGAVFEEAPVESPGTYTVVKE